MTTESTPNGRSLLISLFLGCSLAVSAGCSSKPKPTYYSSSRAGSSCFAKALPTAGEGGLAFGATLQMARQKSLNNCIRYAGRSGGTPETCRVVLAECK